MRIYAPCTLQINNRDELDQLLDGNCYTVIHGGITYRYPREVMDASITRFPAFIHLDRFKVVYS